VLKFSIHHRSKPETNVFRDTGVFHRNPWLYRPLPIFTSFVDEVRWRYSRKSFICRWR